MATVFITAEDPRFDYSSAYQYGEKLVGVFPPGQIHLHPKVAVAQARKVLREMREGDALALVGDPVKIAICATVAAEMVPVVRMLRFNRHTHSYLPIDVEFIAELSPTPTA